MKKRLFISVAMLAGGAAAIFCSRWSNSDPLHKGEPISYWVDRAVMSYPAPDGSREELKEIGPRAIPYLIQKLKPRNTRVWNSWAVIWTRLPAFAQRMTPKPLGEAAMVRAQAAE